MLIDAVAWAVVAIAALVVIYHHLIYPVLLPWLARRFGTDASPPPVATEELPPVALVIPAHNEAAIIAAKIENCAALDYPRDRLRIVLALDGCRDLTRANALAALERSPRDLRIEIIEYPDNIGKIAVLNDRIADVGEPIVVLTDASALLKSDLLRRAASHFRRPEVGVVFATYALLAAGSEGERRYTEFQTRLKANEGRLAEPMGGHGACYLIRRAAWQSIPADTINDDFMLPMGIVANGWRAVYDADLEVTELEKTGSRQEFRRRMRIGAGNMQQSLRLWRLADPRRGWLAFVFVSGKGARPFMPFIMIAAMIALAVLAVRGSLLAAVGYVTAVTLLAATALAITLRLRRLPRPVLWFVYLVEGYTASLVGAVKYLVGQRVAGWQPSGTPRPAVRVDPSAGPSP